MIIIGTASLHTTFAKKSPNETLRKRVLDKFRKQPPRQTPVESRLEDSAKLIVFRLRVSEITGVYENW